MLKPDTWLLTILLASLTALGPLSTDMYLPALPGIMRDLGTASASVQLTLSMFLVGFAVGQVFYGPLADRLGRKPVLLTGLGIYAVASLACTLAPTVEILIVARFLQAFGAAGPVVLARAIVRDLYEGPRAGHELARMGSIMGLAPAIAPFFGGLIASAGGWRFVFLVSLVFAVVVMLAIGRGLPETLKQPETEPFSPGALFRGFASLLRHGLFRAYLLIVTLTYSGLFAFISGSSFVLQDGYGLTPAIYGIAFGVCAGAYVCGTIIGQKIAPRHGVERTIALGVVCLALGGAAMLIALASAPSALSVIVPMMLYMAGVGLALPQSQAAALMPFPERAGTASSLMGIGQMATAAVIGIGVSASLDGSGLALAGIIAAHGFLAALVFFVTRGARRAV
ncbi:multidrug effflux MFS transporter [Stappia sp. ES.058]|uniref:multidrug effflux MFS transporter n=1 Tax=Stappia sp. ES.058 TaxID=1881061 RepID=UPI00087BF24D|nr:multidrug effflux MFS transporter [Stappia sp. ES.058]SDU44365.1 MFS transporter, DHA1 family, bicyclomycin/chloramphenicol resistance protein [Stappia sp. ES.058]